MSVVRIILYRMVGETPDISNDRVLGSDYTILDNEYEITPPLVYNTGIYKYYTRSEDHAGNLSDPSDVVTEEYRPYVDPMVVVVDSSKSVINITVNADNGWSVVDSQRWFVSSGLSSSGFTLTIEANGTGNTRQGTVTVNGADGDTATVISITQGG